MSYSFRFFGHFEILEDNAPASSKLRGKTLAMVAYLACNTRPQPRQVLAELFCSETDDRAASLRWHLSRIRKDLGKEFLHADGPRLSIQYPREHTDIHQFEHTLSTDLEQRTTAQLQAALELYQGEFLKGFHLKQAPHFEIWLSGERSRLALLYEKGTKLLIQQLVEQAHHTEAIKWSQRILELDPLREEIHSLLMWLYARNGQRDAAIQQYALCKQLRQEQLDIELTDETEELYQQVLEGDFSPTYTSFLGTTQPKTQTATPTTTLLGRATQQQQLLERWQQAQRGQHHCVLIEAESGNGKTALVREFTTHHSPDLLEERCQPSDQQLPYMVWSRLLRPLLDELLVQTGTSHSFVLEQVIRLFPQWGMQHVDQPPQPLPHTPEDTYRFFTALSTLLTSKEGRPIVIFLDDLHWADEASLELFDFLLNHPANQPHGSLLIGCMRDEDPHPLLQHIKQKSRTDEQIQLIKLPPLTQDDLLPALQSSFPALQQDEHTALCDKILTYTKGNALYTQEYLEQWDPSQPNDFVPVSEKIQSVLQQALDTFPQAHRQCIECIALFAHPVHFTQLQRASQLSEEDVMRAVERGLQKHLLLSHGQPSNRTYGFRHILLQHTLREQISPVRKQLLHKRIALALEQTKGHPTQLAHHWRYAGDTEKERTYLQLVIDTARTQKAYEEAIQWLKRGLFICKGTTAALPFYKDLAEIYMAQRQFTLAQPLLKEYASQARSLRDDEHILLSTLANGRLYRRQGEHSSARRWLRKALQFAQSKDLHDLEIQVLNSLIKSDRQEGLFDSALQYSQQKIDLAQQLSNNRYLSEGYAALGSIYIQQGAFERALETFEKTLQLAIDEEEQLLHEEEQLSFGDESQFTISRIMGSSGFFANEQDKYIEALQYFEEQMMWLDEAGEEARLRRGLEHLSKWHVWMGNVERALDFLQQHFALATRQFSIPGICKAAGNIGQLYCQLGALPQAYTCFAYKLSMGLDLKSPDLVVDALNEMPSLQARQQLDDDFDAFFSLAQVLCTEHGLFYQQAEGLYIQAWRRHRQGLPDPNTPLSECIKLNTTSLQARDLSLWTACLQAELAMTSSPTPNVKKIITSLEHTFSDATPTERLLQYDTMRHIYTALNRPQDTQTALENIEESGTKHTPPSTLPYHFVHTQLQTKPLDLPALPKQMKAPKSRSLLKRAKKLLPKEKRQDLS